jgi:hypothetical protein
MTREPKRQGRSRHLDYALDNRPSTGDGRPAVSTTRQPPVGSCRRRGCGRGRRQVPKTPDGARSRMHGLQGHVQAIFCRRRHQPRRPPQAKIEEDGPSPMMQARARGHRFEAARLSIVKTRSGHDGAASQARNPAATTTCASFWRKAVGSLVRQSSRQLGVDGR